MSEDNDEQIFEQIERSLEVLNNIVVHMTPLKIQHGSTGKIIALKTVWPAARVKAALEILMQILRRLESPCAKLRQDSELLQCVLDDLAVIRWCLRQVDEAITKQEQDIMLDELEDVIQELDALTLSVE